MRKTFQYKLYRTKRNRYLHGQIDTAAEIYNHCLALHKRYYLLFGNSLNKFQLQKHIAKLKKLKSYEHWRQVGSQAIQDITDRIERAYKLFFDSLKTKRKTALPSFKKRFKYKSFTLKQAGYKLLKGNYIQIGKKIFRYHHSRAIDGKIKTLSVKRDLLGDVYLFFSCEVSDVNKTRVMTGKSAGFDFGLKTFLKPSDESKPINSPEFFKKNIKKIKDANRAFSRKKRGANNRRKARLNIARSHKRIANKRKDFHFKLAKKLSEKYDNMFFEDLDIKSLQKKWGRKISDLGFYNFIHILKYCCQKKGTVISFVDRFFLSSKLCHVCGFCHENLTLKDRKWSCPICKTHHDREENAAINIYREGASSLGLEDVRPSQVAVFV